jgi:hypothetical protein
MNLLHAFIKFIVSEWHWSSNAIIVSFGPFVISVLVNIEQQNAKNRLKKRQNINNFMRFWSWESKMSWRHYKMSDSEEGEASESEESQLMSVWFHLKEDLASSNI